MTTDNKKEEFLMKAKMAWIFSTVLLQSMSSFAMDPKQDNTGNFPNHKPVITHVIKNLPDSELLKCMKIDKKWRAIAAEELKKRYNLTEQTPHGIAMTYVFHQAKSKLDNLIFERQYGDVMYLCATNAHYLTKIIQLANHGYLPAMEYLFKAITESPDQGIFNTFNTAHMKYSQVITFEPTQHDIEAKKLWQSRKNLSNHIKKILELDPNHPDKNSLKNLQQKLEK
jgi:hypothetical protein